MPFKVFLSYGSDPDEQVTAWRLQTLATSHGIHVFVPQRSDIQPLRRSPVPAEVRRQIEQSDCVLAIIARGVGPAVEGELTYAVSRGKLVVPILQEGVPQPAFLKKFRTFSFTPWNPAGVEAEVLEFLKSQRKKISEDNQQAIGALIAIGLGLFVLLSLTKK
jgi:nucleoside 2-deoxyribosyltransferase